MATVPDASLFRLRDSFVGWQCRIRQHAMRMEGGRPPAGARPRVEDDAGTVIADSATLLLLKRDPEADTPQLRHIVNRTYDPAERYSKGLEFLSAAYYQHARDFSDVMTGLFGERSDVALTLLRAGRCVLVFEQHQQSWRVPCNVTEAGRDQPAWAATWWHNAIFNPQIPPQIRVLVFKPRWVEASANPPPP